MSNSRRARSQGLENAKNFLELLDRDEALQGAVRDCVLAEDHIVRIGKTRGFEFSTRELDEALLGKWGNLQFKKIHAMVTFSQAPGF